MCVPSSVFGLSERPEVGGLLVAALPHHHDPPSPYHHTHSRYYTSSPNVTVCVYLGELLKEKRSKETRLTTRKRPSLSLSLSVTIRLLVEGRTLVVVSVLTIKNKIKDQKSNKNKGRRGKDSVSSSFPASLRLVVVCRFHARPSTETTSKRIRFGGNGDETR